MDTGLRQRQKTTTAEENATSVKEAVGHPGGEIKHSGTVQIVRLLLCTVYFITACCCIQATQFLGAPLYFIDKDWYYAYMAYTKQSFGIFVTTLTQWWAPTVVRISGDASVAGELQRTADGGVECHFPPRLVMIANHQLYSDWLYLWWFAYTNVPKMHGYIYIIAKEQLKHVPIIGWGMQFFSFIFMSRKWATDKARLAYRLEKLKKTNADSKLNPMWLLLYPEGTNASSNTRKKSLAWAEKLGVKDPEHVLLPRSTGTFFILNELKGTVDYVYDCTVAYEGVPRGQYGQDLFTLRSIYLQGRRPASVNMYWRRFAIAVMPLHDHDTFDAWLRERWNEKDALMDYYLTNGRFPENAIAKDNVDSKSKEGFIETEVKLTHWWEVGNIFVVLATIGLVLNLLGRGWNMAIPVKTV